MSISEELRKAVTKLEQERDELRVRLNLAKHEIRDEWEEAEKRLAGLRSRLHALSEEAGAAGADARTAVQMGIEDLRSHFKRLRERL